MSLILNIFTYLVFNALSDAVHSISLRLLLSDMKGFITLVLVSKSFLISKGWSTLLVSHCCVLIHLPSWAGYVFFPHPPCPPPSLENVRN